MFTLNHPTISILELQQLPIQILQLIPAESWWILRIPQAILILLSVILLAKYFFKKNYLFAFAQLFTMPWLIINAHELNFAVSFYILGISLYLTRPNLKKWVVILFLMVSGFLIFSQFDSLLDIISSRFSLLVHSLNLTTLFMQMEPNSSYVKVPRNGYFFLIYLIPFLSIIYQEARIKANIFILYIAPLLFSVIFFFLFPSDHSIQAASGILLLMSLMVVSGTIRLIQGSRVRTSIATVLIALSSIFFFEMYLRQYPVMYAGERSEGKFLVMEYVRDTDARKYYLPADADLKYLLSILPSTFSRKNIVFISQQSEWLSLETQCRKKEVVCILDEGTIKEYPIGKDDTSITPIRLRNYLSIYYIL